MNNVKYIDKYKKYKQKYIELKQQIGGSFAFTNGQPFYILYLLDDETTKYAVSERRSILLNNSELIRDHNRDNLKLHFTLFNFQINNNHKNKDIFTTPEFIQLIRDAFNENLDKQILIHTTNDYKILSNFYGKEYNLAYPSKITDFRIRIYEYISRMLLEGKSPIQQPRGDFMYLNVNGNDLIAVPLHNWGKENWLTHISLLEFRNDKFPTLSLYHNNHELYQNIKPYLQEKNIIMVKHHINKYITDRQNQVLTQHNATNLRGQPRINVVPFKNLILTKEAPIQISMDRNNPKLNWFI